MTERLGVSTIGLAAQDAHRDSPEISLQFDQGAVVEMLRMNQGGPKAS